MPAQEPLHRILVFSDLDGSLLDHDTYDWKGAAQGLAILKRAGIPVIIMTSKTAAEVIPLTRELGFSDYPFGVENGSTIHLPDKWRNENEAGVITLGSGMGHICQVLRELRGEGYDFTGFSEVSPKDIAHWTGLSEQSAELAQQREATEPIVWNSDDSLLPKFVTALKERGLDAVKGGRFLHVMPKGINKGHALQWVTHRFISKTGSKVNTIAFGDGCNDVPMLEEADRGVLIQSRHVSVKVRSNHVYRTQASGPSGWLEGLDHWQQKYAALRHFLEKSE